MAVLNNPAGYIASGLIASGAGRALDTRHCRNYGYLWYVTQGDSARLAVQISHDGTAWLDHSIYTATTTSGTAQLAAFFPYIRATVTNRYGNATAYAHYSPGL